MKMERMEKMEFLLGFFLLCIITLILSLGIFSPLSLVLETKSQLEAGNEDWDLKFGEVVCGEDGKKLYDINAMYFIADLVFSITKYFAVGLIAGYVITRYYLDIRNKYRKEGS